MSAFHVRGALSKPSSFSARFGLTTKFLVFFHCQHTSIPPFQPSFSHYQLKALHRKFRSSDKTSLFLLTSSSFSLFLLHILRPLDSPFPVTPPNLSAPKTRLPSAPKLSTHPIPSVFPNTGPYYPFPFPPPPRPYPAPPTLSTSTPRSYKPADLSTGTSLGQQAVICAVRASRDEISASRRRRAFTLLGPWVLLSGDGDRDRGV